MTKQHTKLQNIQWEIARNIGFDILKLHLQILWDLSN
jgi:hypothetical protein